MRVKSTVKNENFACDCEAIHAETVGRVRALMPDGGELRALCGLYKMFANHTRVKILWSLSRGELCVCDLAVLLGMTKSAVSHQLKALRLSDLVKCEKRGKEAYYSLADAHVKDIFEKGFEHIQENK